MILKNSRKEGKDRSTQIRDRARQNHMKRTKEKVGDCKAREGGVGDGRGALREV